MPSATARVAMTLRLDIAPETVLHSAIEPRSDECTNEVQYT